MVHRFEGNGKQITDDLAEPEKIRMVKSDMLLRARSDRMLSRDVSGDILR